MTQIHSLYPISETHVRAALDGLLYKVTAYREPNPLEDLRLVDWLCASPTFPDTPMKRQLALADALTALIAEAYSHHRRVHGLESPQNQTALTEARIQITQDAAAQSPELRAWGWLYYRYVRIDLDITLSQFAGMCCVDVRTLQRYAAHGVRRLTERLVFLERQVRMERQAS
ncbi:MAG: hypothetical protein K8L97_09780 [Anaerolineae bacterium]|nr:hypothetical protein [Anaerolineae bacterium]